MPWNLNARSTAVCVQRPLVTLEQRCGGWVAIPRGESSPLIRLVHGNAYPGGPAWWLTKDEAIRELSEWGFDLFKEGR